jgi:sugar O-acyltransferase (sialic acid O-acetyltransferase NeuD family)
LINDEVAPGQVDAWDLSPGEGDAPGHPSMTVKAVHAAASAPFLHEDIDLSAGSASVVIAGDGAHARWLADLVRRAGTLQVAGCTSPQHPRGAKSGDLLVLGTDADLPAILAAGVTHALVGVGSSRSGRRSNDLRARLFATLRAAGFVLPVVIDPDASVSSPAELGEGTVIGAKAVVSAGARIGRNVLVNVGAIVCHDAVVEDHVHLTPGAILAGTTFVGEGSTIGMAATVLDGTRVGRRCLVLNGARVIRDVPDDSVVAYD